MRLLPAAAVLVLAAGLAFGLGRALTPPAPPSPQLAVEQRLMCPQCTQTRLDVCDRPICNDMKAEIRRRLASGEPADAIVTSFAQRYGQDVLAAPPPLVDAAGLLPWMATAAALVALVWAAMRIRPHRPHPAP